MREDGLAGAWMFRLGGAAGKQDIAGPQSKRGEKRLHAVVIGLAPAVEGMMMALGTGDAQTEEDLGQSAGPVAGLGHDLVEVGRPASRQRALGGDNLAGELVERNVPGDAIANPPVVMVGGLVAQDLAVDPQQVGPFERPEIGELRPLQELIDQAGSAVAAPCGPGFSWVRW